MVNLTYQGRTTAAHQKLLDGQTPDGARVVRRAKGFSDYDVINALVREGWLQARASGPRGGTRWFTTPAGAAAMAALDTLCERIGSDKFNATIAQVQA